MGRWLVAILLVVVGASGGYAASETFNDDEDSSAPNTISWLFAITGGSGSLTEDSSGEVALRFDDVRDGVVAFSDRPERYSGHIPLASFLDSWDEGKTFANDPPNAELGFVSADGKQFLLTVELLSVSQGDGVTFAARVVGSETGLAAAPRDFSSATLFIDDVETPQQHSDDCAMLYENLDRDHPEDFYKDLDACLLRPPGPGA